MHSGTKTADESFMHGFSALSNHRCADAKLKVVTALQDGFLLTKGLALHQVRSNANVMGLQGVP